MNLIGYSPHLLGILIIWFFLEWLFYERKKKIRAVGMILRISLLVVVAMVIVHFTLMAWNGQFKKKPIIKPEPTEAVWT